VNSADELAALRAKLDGIDDDLLRALARRAEVVAEIWAWKQHHGVARVDPDRERAMRERLLSRAAELGLSREAVALVFDSIIGKALR
jgi:chorismate mutase